MVGAVTSRDGMYGGPDSILGGDTECSLCCFKADIPCTA